MTNPLDILTARVGKKIEEEKRLKDAKAKAKAAIAAGHYGSAKEANAEATEIQNAMDWKAIALVQHKDHWKCACGVEGEAPSGVLVLYEHTRISNATRQAAPRSGGHLRGEEQPHNSLPRRVQVNSRVVAMCPVCGPNFGFTKLLEKS
jgi:hypothetical protein